MWCLHFVTFIYSEREFNKFGRYLPKIKLFMRQIIMFKMPQKWLQHSSISTSTALMLSMMMSLIFAAASISVFYNSRATMLNDALERLNNDNSVTVERSENFFSRMIATHLRAEELFRIERNNIAKSKALQELNTLYPARDDGTRRSILALYEGYSSPFGFVRGMFGYMKSHRGEEKAIDVIAATHAMNRIGEGSSFDLETLYFFTPDEILLMFAPDRTDQLNFYRNDANAGLALKKNPYFKLVSKTVNPQRITRCTALQQEVSGNAQPVWTTGCITPVDIDGEHIGSFGTSIPLNALLDYELHENPNFSSVILISSTGQLILHPDYIMPESNRTQRYIDLSEAKDPKLRALWEFVQSQRGQPFLGYSQSLESYISIKKIPTPGWYSVTIEEQGKLHSLALRSVWRLVLVASLSLVFLVVLIIIILQQNVGKPLRALTRETEEMTAKLVDNDDRHNGRRPYEDNEVIQLAHSFHIMAKAVISSKTALEEKVKLRTRALHEANSKLKKLTEIDPLTGLYNRRKIMAVLDDVIEKAKNSHATSSLSLLILDADHFKAINDNYGHVVGDEVLRNIARRSEILLRPGDPIGRIGGEEFMAILQNTQADQALKVANRLREGIAQTKFNDSNGKEFQVTLSIGLSILKPGDSIKEIYERADQCLYEAKNNGRNKVVQYQEPVPEESFPKDKKISPKNRGVRGE